MEKPEQSHQSYDKGEESKKEDTAEPTTEQRDHDETHPQSGRSWREVLSGHVATQAAAARIIITDSIGRSRVELITDVKPEVVTKL